MSHLDITPWGPAMARLIGQSCPADRSSDVGAQVFCDRFGIVVAARVELDGYSMWGNVRGALQPAITTPGGLRLFAQGAWEPPASKPTLGKSDRRVARLSATLETKHHHLGQAVPRPRRRRSTGNHTVDGVELIWHSRACPKCRRTVVQVTVGIRSQMIGSDGEPREPVDAPDPRRAKVMQIVRQALARSPRSALALLRHRDPLFRVAALTRLSRDVNLPEATLARLLADTDTAVRRLARPHIFHRVTPARVAHAAAALERPYPIAFATMWYDLVDDARWIAQPVVRSALRRLAKHYPDRVTRRRAAQLLESRHDEPSTASTGGADDQVPTNKGPHQRRNSD